MTKLSKVLFALFAIGAVSASAQTNRGGNWCKFDEKIQAALAIDPYFLDQFYQQAKQHAANNKKASPYIIPVVVHNITHDGGQGYVSKSTIEGAIDRLNIDFNRLNSDTVNTRSLFKPLAGSIDIEFRLAHKDPNGDCTEGIVRLEDPSSANFSDGNKGVSYWDSKKYFNIWLVDQINGSNPPSYIAGYAQFPYGPGGGINSTYGVVVDDSFFGPNDRTLTHEIGHCFGLLHTFQSGCGSNCSSSGDFMCDTPPAQTDTYGCNTSQNSCSNDANGPDPFGGNVVDQIENYMSYDACQNMFSLEQVATMTSTLNSTSTTQGLDQLNTTTNHNLTGVNNPYGPVICTPVADFTYSRDLICEGASVTYTDQSWNATPTSWSWTFTGGTPGSSTQQNPSITYNTAGVYGATLQSTTTAGTGSITKNSIITVSSLTADYTSPFSDGLENTTSFNNEWFIENGNDNTNWSNTNATAASGARCARLLNYTTSSSNTDVDALITPSYNLSTSTNKTLRFKVAYCNRSASNTDKLFLYYSLNCGQTWSLKTPYVNASLTTAPTQSSYFTPNASQWVEKSVDFSSIGSNTNVRFKFEFTAGGGNNIYIDDINVGSAVGIDELNGNIAQFDVYPNPTSSSAKIAFTLSGNVANLSIQVKNSLGQLVTRVINGQSFSAGKYTLNIDEERKLSRGIYFIEFVADGVAKTQKLIVQ
ncbi:MAG: T9SS type A sorting domain-containing protein [Flavobacteriales bacterium]|nr:T9SS type A sorting domain-containing protein [Flavobacteriales bacterium]